MFDNFTRYFGWPMLIEALLLVVPALFCITLHELAHGFTAYRLGDNTAKSMGRLTLNPIKHIDIFGLLMMLVVRFGWAKPVPVNMRNFKRPIIGMAVTAIAGPVSNIIIAAVVLFIYGLVYFRLGGLYAVGAARVALQIIERTAYLSIALAVFNLIPIPPLDGSKVLFSFLPEHMYYKLMRYERYGMLVLVLVLTTDLFQRTIGRLTLSLFNSMFIIAETANRLIN